MINELKRLPELPKDLLLAVRQAFQQESGFGELSALLDRNPGASRNLFKLMNTPSFKAGSGTRDLEDAARAVGAERVRSLIIALILGDYITRGAFGNALDPGRYYIHSLAAAAVARKTARLLRVHYAEKLYLIGLFHDLGKIALDSVSKSKYREVMDQVDHGKSYAEAELQAFGRDHRQVWDMLACSWKFPSDMVGLNHGVLAPRMNLETRKLVDDASMMADALGYMITLPVSRRNRKEADVFSLHGEEAILDIGRTARSEVESLGAVLGLPLPGESQTKETLLRNAVQFFMTHAKYIATHHDLESRIEGLEELTRVFTGIIRTLDDESLAFSVLEAVIEGFQLDGAFLLNGTAAGGLAGYMARTTSLGEAEVGRVRFSNEQVSPYIRKCIDCRRPVRIRNPMEEEILRACLDEVSLAWLSPIYVRGRFTALLGLGVKDKIEHKLHADDFGKMLKIVSGEVGLSFENTQLYQRMQKKASTDPLTHLSNRRAIMQILAAEFARFKRKDNPLTVAIFDLDNFKAFNDRNGHLAGDRLLVKAASVLKKGLRDSDFIGRYGGDEFIAVFPETTTGEAREVTERIRKDLLKYCIITGASKSRERLCVSVGIAGALEGMNRPDALILAADQALYAAKKSGRNSCRVYGAPKPLPKS